MSAYENLTAYQNTLNDVDPFAPYSDEYIALYLAYLGEMFPNMDAQRLAGHFGVLPYNKALAPIVALETPQSAPVTDLDPQSTTLPEGRYHGTLNANRLYIHVPALHADFRVVPDEICGANVDQIAAGQLLEVSINASFETALRVVIVGNLTSMSAYNMKYATPQPARIDTTRRPRNLAEARAQAEQRKRDAAQREQARKNAHQTQDTRYVFYNSDGTYDIDDRDGHEIEF